MDGSTATVEYFCRIMIEDDTLLLKNWVRRISTAPLNARRYLQMHCQTVPEFENFFRDNSDYFFSENGRVALYNEDLVTSAKMAEEYFREALESFDYPVHYIKLKEKYFGNAPEDVKTFITRFYPGKEFKNFFKLRPNVFAFKDSEVFLIDVESVAFFEKRLEKFGGENLSFINFRGHVAAAPKHIQDYINRNYFGDKFQVFLRNHSDVFKLDKNNCVSLMPLKKSYAGSGAIKKKRNQQNHR